jgi:uronate dehydrogenase
MKLKQLLITGAAGGLGRMVRQRLTGLAQTLRLSDVSAMEPARTGEEVVIANLADSAAVDDLVAGSDGVIHFGGISVEDAFAPILEANIKGVYNLYEAARRNGCPRILLASSNHVVGFHRQDDYLDANASLEPDSLYGVSKCFGEHMARLYHHKFGLETAIVRIGSCFPEPRDHRMLATWLSPDDFISLIHCVFSAPRLGCPIIYGVSANEGTWWDNSEVAWLGWRPKDNSEQFRSKLDKTVARPPRDSIEATYQGGKFAADGIHE